MMAATSARPVPHHSGRWQAWVTAAVPAVLFGLRLTAAVGAALFIAFWLQLENASWAGTSAAIVCQPVLGAALRKGVFRLVGTTIGAVATVVLTAAFPQDRIGFLLGMTVWCAVCSFASTLLRNFASYAAMLAGYTMVIIASSSIAAPDQVFLLALSRATEISLGIVCGTVVMATTAFGRSHLRLATALSALITETGAGLVAQLHRAGRPDESFRTRRRELLKRTAALDPLLDETIGVAPAVAYGRTTLRAGIHGLYLALAAWRTLELHLRRLPAADATREADTLLGNLPPGIGAAFRGTPGERNASAVASDQAIARREAWFAGAHSLRDRPVDTPARRLGLDRLASVSEGLGRAVNAIVLLTASGRARGLRAVPTTFMPDALPPLVNAARVFIAVGAGVLLYIATSWDQGPTFLTFLAVTVLLLSPRDEAAFKGAVGFGAGTVMTAIIAAFVKFAILPNHESYGSFVLIIGCVLVPMAALSTRPSLAPIFGAATMNFIPLLGPSNEISYDTASYYNGALAIVGGSIAGSLMLRVIPPVPTRIRTRRLLGLTLRDLRRLARRPTRWTTDQWRSRIYARLTALPPDAKPADGSCLLAALTIGLQVLALHDACKQTGRETALEQMFLVNLRHGRVEDARETLGLLKEAIGHWPTADATETRRLRWQVAAREISDVLKDYGGYFGAVIA